MIWPPHRVKMASTPSFLSALATRLPPEIFWLASAATLGATPSEEPTVDLLAAPAMFILLHEHLSLRTERDFNRTQPHAERMYSCAHFRTRVFVRLIYRLAASAAIGGSPSPSACW